MNYEFTCPSCKMQEGIDAIEHYDSTSFAVTKLNRNGVVDHNAERIHDDGYTIYQCRACGHELCRNEEELINHVTLKEK